MKWLSLVAFLGCIIGANAALARWGIVPIGFGLAAPAGVYFAGVSFAARDALRETSSQRVVFIAIAVGAAVSFMLEDARRFAIASGIAFALSETADALVYEPLRERTRMGAVIASNTVGLVLDSAVFLWLAFGSLAFIEGQIVGKAYMTALAVLLMWGWRAVPQRRRATRTSA